MHAMMPREERPHADMERGKELVSAREGMGRGRSLRRYWEGKELAQDGEGMERGRSLIRHGKGREQGKEDAVRMEDRARARRSGGAPYHRR
jgi:hypothetical protein